MFTKAALLAGTLALVGAATSGAKAQCSQPDGFVPGKTFDRLFTVFFENEDRDTVLKNADFQKAARKGIEQYEYYAETHPSQGNYIAYVSGSLNGVTGDANVNLDAPSIADRLDDAGISWGAYAEALPSSNYTGARSGTYYRKHEPFISFNSIRNDANRVKNIKNADALADDVANNRVPQYVFFAPDINNDGHDTDTAYAGEWLSGFLDKYLDFFMQTNTVLHLTFDESETYVGPNLVYSAILGGAVDPSQAGTVDQTYYDHYSGLRTVEDNWDLIPLTSNDANGTPFSGIKRNPSLCG